MQIASSNVSSNATQEAALEKQIKAKEDEAKSVKDQVQAAKLQQEIAALKAKLAALEAADKAAQQEQSAPSTAAARQAEFDGATTDSSNAFWM
jgi:predicted  nucleic acid-binding Zn-ribbon protein